MGFKQELQDIQKWFTRMNPIARLVLLVIVISGALFLSGAGKHLAGPLLVALFWTVLTIENRTVSLNTLILAGAGGLMVLLPAAAVVSSPFMIFLHQYSVLSLVFNMTIEMLMMIGCIGLLLWWPKSRLRFSSSILDFALIGLWIGSGLEWGIVFLQQSPLSFKGVSLGILPQWPGLIGHPSKAFAAIAPSMVGLLFGVVVGLIRYLIGPDIKGVVRRILVGSLLGLIMAWVILERLAFMSDELYMLPQLFYSLDLKGRLLAYLTGLLTAIVIVVEWLLLREYKFISDFNQTLKVYLSSWSHGQQATLQSRFSNLKDLITQRSMLREIALAEETKSLMSDEDKRNVEQRILAIRKALIEGGWQG